MMKCKFLKYAPIALLPILCVYAWSTYRQRQAIRSTSPVAYQVLEDAMGTTMRIGVESNVTEEQLMATLSRAADEHQYDAARDLMLSSYFSVEAYLLDDGKRSSELAGSIKRYVAPKRTPEHGNWWEWLPALYGRDDKFSITLNKARGHLR